MNKKKILRELEGMTNMFCATFHQCANKILKNPAQIPKTFIGKESQYIGQVCINKVVQLSKNK